MMESLQVQRALVPSILEESLRIQA